jgi:hypothetical protein
MLEASVKETKLSDGSTEYFVYIKQDGRYLTPHKLKNRGRAEYEVAIWNWVFNGGEEPCILEFDTEHNNV